MQTPYAKLVIFDCDGVLIDSEVLSMESWQEVLVRYDVSLSKQYFVEHFLGKSMEHVEWVVNRDFCLELTTSIKKDFQALLFEKFGKSLQKTRGITDVLAKLKARNIPYCVATSSSLERTIRALENTELLSYFDGRIFTRSLVEEGKPAPDLFLYAAKTLNVKPEHCIVIEDSQPGLAAARAAKMPYFHYKGGTHLHNCTGNEFSSESNTLHSWNEFIPHISCLFDTRKTNE